MTKEEIFAKRLVVRQLRGERWKPRRFEGVASLCGRNPLLTHYSPRVEPLILGIVLLFRAVRAFPFR